MVGGGIGTQEQIRHVDGDATVRPMDWGLAMVRADVPGTVGDPAEPPAAVRSWYARHGKRLGDVVVASVALVLLSPLLALTAIVVACALGRPVLYRQRRVGCGGEPFELLKFRTMRHDRRGGDEPPDGEYGGPERRLDHKRDDDPRHVPVGRFLRRTSIDELPQLWNVLRGQMSIVGPRPEIVAVAERRGLVDHPRHLVRPGITGLCQVSGDRPGYVHENVHHDERYVAEVSAGLDVRIVLRTFAVVLRGGGR